MTDEILASNTLLTGCNPLLSMAVQLIKEASGAKLAQPFQERIAQEFDRFERYGFEQQLDIVTIQSAKYALAAFIDEVVITSNWEGRLAWMGKTLQLQFFGEHLAGEGFFKRLQDLMVSPHKNLALLEVYYLCLQLGFKGRYRLHNTEQLLTVNVDLRSQIELARGTIDPRLAPNAIPKASMITRMSREIPLWIIGSVAGAILLLIYMGYSFAIQHQADQALAVMKTQQAVLLQTIKPIANNPHTQPVNVGKQS